MKKIIGFVAILATQLSYANTPVIEGKSNFDQTMLESAVLILTMKGPNGKVLCSTPEKITSKIIQEKTAKNSKKYSKELWHLSGCESTEAVIATLYPSGLVEIQRAKNESHHSGQGRSASEIKLTMDQHKAAIYSVYKRALLEEPNLAGKMIVKITINSEGNVTDTKLVSSQLGDNELENAILRRIRLIQFPAADVEKTIINQTFDFLPQ